jgi:hypothetical protein
VSDLPTISARLFRLRAASVLALLVVAVSPAARVAAEEPAKTLGVGATFDSLAVGSATYRNVVVRSVNSRTLTIAHAGGLAAIKLRDLPPALQAAFGYSPEAEAAADARLESAQAGQQKKVATDQAKRSTREAANPSAAFERLLQNFGRAPELRPLVDLRPTFFQLSLNAKNQGPRPSCAIFAIVSALEYQNAQLTGRAERFSEEYLLWATCKTLNRAPRFRPDAVAGADEAEDLDNLDEGFALAEVVPALRAYGVPLQDSLPYSFARDAALKDPAPAVLDEARNRRHVSVVALPGHDQSTVLANLIQSLNAGIPVAVGMRWPAARALKGNFLNTQKPRDGSGHAVTIVGYENKSGALADTVFVFKNSWGPKWGVTGYGFVSYRYLFNNLTDTAILDVALNKG